jgi:type IV fimbrial biogenesis protein FimT
MKFSKRLITGFTLLELLIVVAIMAILAVIAVPFMNRTVATHRVNNRADQLQALIQFARSEAVRTNKPILVCPTLIRKNLANTYACKQFAEYKNGTGWQGLLAFSDINLNGSYDANTDNTVRVAVLNQNTDDLNKIKVKAKMKIFCSSSTKNNCNESLDGQQMLGFMPNGQFGIGFGEQSSNWSIAQSNFVFELYDSKNTDISQRLIISSGGNIISCAKNANTNNILCDKKLD